MQMKPLPSLQNCQIQFNVSFAFKWKFTLSVFVLKPIVITNGIV